MPAVRRVISGVNPNTGTTGLWIEPNWLAPNTLIGIANSAITTLANALGAGLSTAQKISSLQSQLTTNLQNSADTTPDSSGAVYPGQLGIAITIRNNGNPNVFNVANLAYDIAVT